MITMAPNYFIVFWLHIMPPPLCFSGNWADTGMVRLWSNSLSSKRTMTKTTGDAVRNIVQSQRKDTLKQNEFSTFSSPTNSAPICVEDEVQLGVLDKTSMMAFLHIFPNQTRRISDGIYSYLDFLAGGFRIIGQVHRLGRQLFRGLMVLDMTVFCPWTHRTSWVSNCGDIQVRFNDSPLGHFDYSTRNSWLWWFVEAILTVVAIVLKVVLTAVDALYLIGTPGNSPKKELLVAAMSNPLQSASFCFEFCQVSIW